MQKAFNIKDFSIPVLCDIKCLQNSLKIHKIILNNDLKRHLLEVLFSELNGRQKKHIWEKLCKDEIIINDSCEYDVEDIIDHKTIQGVKYYLVKWKGWPTEFNEWLKETNLNCGEILENYLNNLHPCYFPKNDFGNFINILFKKTNSQKDILFECCKIVETFNKSLNLKRIARLARFNSMAYIRINNSRSKSYKERKREQADMLKDWERHINKIEQGSRRINVENDVDIAGPPENFIYINKRIAGHGVELQDASPSFGCLCIDCYKEKNTCCASHFDSKFAYLKSKKLRFSERSLIVECNSLCKCGSDCPNRVVQNGRRYKLAIFRTSNGKGWGVKTLESISRGSFVIEYIGEVITTDEAERRGLEYDNEGMTYLFDLDFPDYDQNEYSIDAKIYGNASHFINHSCDPNLNVYPLLDNNMNIKQHRLCFFANKNIIKGEELSFDYNMRVESNEDTNDTISSGSYIWDTRDLISSSVSQESTKNLYDINKHSDLENLNDSNKQLEPKKLIDFETSELSSNYQSTFISDPPSSGSFLFTSTATFYSRSKKRPLSSKYNDQAVDDARAVKKSRSDSLPCNLKYQRNNYARDFKLSMPSPTCTVASENSSANKELCLESIENIPDRCFFRNVKRQKTIEDYFSLKIGDASTVPRVSNRVSIDSVYDESPGEVIDADNCVSTSGLGSETSTSYDRPNKITNNDESNRVAVPCFCGAANCRGYITKFIRNL